MSDAKTTVVQKKAIDITPYNHALWCSIGNGEPFANMIYWRNWSDDGERIIFGLDTHNGFSAKPDELVGVVEGTDGHASAEFLAERLREDSEKMASKPSPKVDPKAEIERLRARIAELEGALADTQALEMNHEGAVVRLMREKEAQAAELERLRIFSNLARIANDEPYMAETGYKLRRAFEYLDRAPAAQAEPQAARKLQVGDEVWWRPFSTMGEREQGRVVKVLKLSSESFRIDDGRDRTYLRDADDYWGTWLRFDSFGVTWWWSEQDCAGDS